LTTGEAESERHNYPLLFTCVDSRRGGNALVKNHQLSFLVAGHPLSAYIRRDAFIKFDMYLVGM
jgi:hypothetical protein